MKCDRDETIRIVIGMKRDLNSFKYLFISLGKLETFGNSPRAILLHYYK